MSELNLFNWHLNGSYKKDKIKLFFLVANNRKMDKGHKIWLSGLCWAFLKAKSVQEQGNSEPDYSENW